MARVRWMNTILGNQLWMPQKRITGVKIGATNRSDGRPYSVPYSRQFDRRGVVIPDRRSRNDPRVGNGLMQRDEERVHPGDPRWQPRLGHIVATLTLGVGRVHSGTTR